MDTRKDSTISGTIPHSPGVSDWKPAGRKRDGRKYQDNFDATFRRKGLQRPLTEGEKRFAKAMIKAGEGANKTLKRMAKQIARDRDKALKAIAATRKIRFRRYGKGSGR